MEQNDKRRSEPHGIRDEKAPECDRCGGLLVLTFYQDLQDDTGQIDISAFAMHDVRGGDRSTHP